MSEERGVLCGFSCRSAILLQAPSVTFIRTYGSSIVKLFIVMNSYDIKIELLRQKL